MFRFISVLLLSLSLTSVAQAADYPAAHCEVFVDRTMSYMGSHAGRWVQFWVKTINSRLDGFVSRVGVHEVNLKTGEVREVTFRSYFGAKDYYESSSYLVSGDYNSGASFRLSFFVETDRGTRYWANAEDGSAFVVDRNMAVNMEPIQGMPRYYPSQSEALVAADQFPYLNPARCR